MQSDRLYYSLYYKVLLSIACVFVVFLSFMLLQQYGHSYTKNELLLFYFFMAALEVMCILGLIESFISYVEFNDTHIVVKNLWKKKFYLVSDASFYLILNDGTDNGTVLFKKNKPNDILVSISAFFKKSSAFQKWLKKHFKSKYLHSKKEEQQMIVNNPDLGVTPKQRKKNFASIQNKISFFNLISIILVYTLIIKIGSNTPKLTLLSIVFPWMLFTALSKYGKALKIPENNHTGTQSIFFSMYFIPWILLTKAWYDFQILNYIPLIVPACLISIVFYFAMRNLLSLSSFLDFESIKSFFIVIMPYALAVSIYGNCYLDQSPSQTYSSFVTHKKSSNGFASTYRLKVTAFFKFKDKTNVFTDIKTYKNLTVDDSVDIYVKPGFFNAHWIDQVKKSF